jgi:hypothetical protein
MMTTLQQNSLENLARTLRDLSSLDRQLKYKAAVPFVHVPVELIAQWDNHARMSREVSWFRELFTQQELDAMAQFHEAVEDIGTAQEGDLPDVPEILTDARWLHLTRLAQDLAGRLASKLPPPTEPQKAAI